MLFSFPKIDHPVTHFHDHIAYFFRQVFKLDLEEFNKELLIHSDFYPIVDASGKFRGLLEKIVTEYYNLDNSWKKDIEISFSSNTCSCLYSDNTIQLVKYNEIPEGISNALRELFDYLWKDFPLVQAGEEQFGSVKEHYKKITKNIKICPFCGLYPILPETSEKREDYDHILPKSKYPFISVNFDFVVPTCDDCNTNEKLAKDPAYDSDNNRRPFYNPYDENIHLDNLTVNIVPAESYNQEDYGALLKSINWDYDIKRNNEAQEEISAWDDVYRIKGRYKEFIKSYETEWYDELIRFYRREKRKNTNFDIIRDDFLEESQYQAIISPLGVVKQSYFNYIFSLQDIEERLNQAIGNQVTTPELANQN